MSFCRFWHDHRKKFSEINCVISVCVNLADYVLKFAVIWRLADGKYDSGQIVNSHSTIAISIHDIKYFSEFLNLFSRVTQLCD
jgi:hypothetical protein